MNSRFCHTERSEVSNMESKQSLDFKIDSSKDFFVFYKNEKCYIIFAVKDLQKPTLKIMQPCIKQYSNFNIKDTQ